jgi:cyclase
MQTIILSVLFLLLPVVLPAQRDWSAMKVSTSEEGPGVYRLFVGDAVAVVVFQGPEGILVVDAAYQQTTSQLMNAIREIDQAPVKYLVNTHIHADHTGGNTVIGKGATIISHQSVKDYLSTERVQGENIIPPMADHGLPKITFTTELELDFNGQVVQMIHLPEGHTNGDIIVYFPESKVLAAGDLLFAGFFPFIDKSNGGTVDGFMRNLEWILLNFPEDTRIIGGHGPVFNMQQLNEYFTELEGSVQAIRNAMDSGMTPGQIKKKGILENWKHFGSFFITEDRWIDTIAGD